MFAKLGYSSETMLKIGVVEIALAMLYLIPRTAFLGAVLLTGYLGGQRRPTSALRKHSSCRSSLGSSPG